MSKLVKDWFGRRAEEAYTFADDSKRFFSWDKGRSSYSSYFINNDSTVKEAAKMVGSMFRVIGVPKTYTYNATGERKVHSVHVPIGMLRDEDGNYIEKDPELLDAFYGAAIQNAALASMQTDSEYSKTLYARDTTRGSLSVRDMLFSVLNTERIDKKLSERLPGYLKFVQKFKNHQYENAPSLPASAPAQQRLMDLIVKMLRYPANISEEDIAEFEKPMKQMERLLKKHGGIPNTSSDCDTMASSLSQIIYKYVEKEEEEEKPEEPGTSDDDSDGSGEGLKPPPAASKPKPDKSELDSMAKEMVKKYLNPEASESDKGLKDAMEVFTEDMEGEQPPKEHDYDKEGEADSRGVIFKKANINKTAYKRVLSRVDVTKAAVLQKLFQRKSKDQAFVVKSMRSGRLDTNKIAEARQNVPTIYERMGHITTNKICVGVLIDESGSMGGTKIEKAREAAIFINEVFRKMPDVQLFIYGHTADSDDDIPCADGKTIMRIYHEKNCIVDPFALGSVEARSNNRDGDAIYGAALRMRSKTPDQGLLFVLSDGQPSAHNYSGRSAIEDTKKKVQKAQALGFQVIQIAIEESVPSAQMFDYFIKMTDIKNLPKDMMNYMSRKVDKMIKEKVTI